MNGWLICWFLILFFNVLPVCMSVHYVWAWCLEGLEEGIRSPAMVVRVVSYHVGVGNQTQDLSARVTNAFCVYVYYIYASTQEDQNRVSDLLELEFYIFVSQSLNPGTFSLGTIFLDILFSSLFFFFIVLYHRNNSNNWILDGKWKATWKIEVLKLLGTSKRKKKD